jgi:hypothetical protein
LPLDDKLFAIRWRMLTALRQLKGKRKAFVLQFLLETGLLLNKIHVRYSSTLPTLNWKFANFDYLDLSPNSLVSAPNIQPLLLANFTAMISLTALNFKNATFDHLSMQFIDFFRADLTNVSSRHSRLIHVSFRQAKLMYSNFAGATVTDCDFTGANLTGSTLTEQQLAGEAHIEGTILSDGKTKAFLDLLKGYHYDQTLGIWVEDTKSRWQTHQYSNNQPEAMIIQSFSARSGWRFEARAIQYVGITRQVNIPSRYKLRNPYQYPYLSGSIRCGKFMPMPYNSNYSIITSYDSRQAYIYVYIQQYDNSHKMTTRDTFCK